MVSSSLDNCDIIGSLSIHAKQLLSAWELHYIPESYGHKSSVCCTNQKARDENSARYASSMCPTGDEKVDNEENPKSRQSEGTCKCTELHCQLRSLMQ